MGMGIEIEIAGAIAIAIRLEDGCWCGCVNGWGVEVVRGGAGMIGICGRREVAFGLG